MTKTASSNSRHKFVSVGRRGVFGLAYLTIAAAVVAASYVSLIAYLKRVDCVVLPNGAMIGHVAVLKFESDVAIDMFLRDASGKIIVRTDGFVNFEFHPSDPDRVLLQTPGAKLDLDARVLMPVVLEERSSWNYVRKWQEIMKGGTGFAHILGTDLYTIYERLRLSPQFEKVHCGTPWFDWGS